MLVVSLWQEPSAASGFRARVTATADISLRDERERYSDSREEIEAIIGRWLDEIAASGPA